MQKGGASEHRPQLAGSVTPGLQPISSHWSPGAVLATSSHAGWTRAPQTRSVGKAGIAAIRQVRGRKQAHALRPRMAEGLVAAHGLGGAAK